MDTHLPITPSGPMPTDVGRNPAETKAATVQRVLTVRHWTDRLFTFTCTRDPAFRFESGQFAMIGLEVAGKPLLRAYSMAGAHHDEHLEFLSIKVPDGPLTSRLQFMQPGDAMLVGRKPTGTLVTSFLQPGGRNLYLVGSGTGLAPFMSLIQDPDVYDQFDRVVLVHGVREVAELAYADRISVDIPGNEFYGELAREKLLYYPTVTREAFRNQGRATDLIETGKLQADLALPPLDPALDRVMICGSPAMLADLQSILKTRGFVEGSSHIPGTYVIEKAFAEA